MTDEMLQANLKRLLADAPPTRCGGCGASMEAYKVELTISSGWDWYNAKQPVTTFIYASPDPWRYTGTIEYRCASCGVSLLHRQWVTRLADGFHFQSASEEASQ